MEQQLVLPEQSSAGDVNGFRTVPELQMIAISDEKELAAFRKPPEMSSFEPDAAARVLRFKNGDSERMIHHGARLDDMERRQLHLLQVEAKRQSLAFFPSIAAAATRFLMDARGDHHAALQKMRDTQTWRKSFFRDGPIRSSDVVALLRLGVIYFCGRDRMLRPALVIRLSRLPAEMLQTEGGVQQIAKVIIFCMECFQKYMTSPGKVENLNLIIDAQGASLSLAKPAALKALQAAVGKQVSGTVFRFYVVNMTFMLRILSSMIQKLMSERQRQKVMLIGSVEEMHTEFAKAQLEVDLGGTRPVITDFWPVSLPPGPFSIGQPSAKGLAPTKAAAMEASPSEDGTDTTREAESAGHFSDSTYEGSHCRAPSSASFLCATRGSLNNGINEEFTVEDCGVGVSSWFSCMPCPVAPRPLNSRSVSP